MPAWILRGDTALVDALRKAGGEPVVQEPPEAPNRDFASFAEREFWTWLFAKTRP